MAALADQVRTPVYVEHDMMDTTRVRRILPPKPRGKAACYGTGFAVLELSGSVYVPSMGGGNAYVHNAQELRVEGQGWSYERGEWTFYQDWEGALEVRGYKFQVQLSGAAINFEAEGNGHIRIRGEGICLLNGRQIELTPEFQDLLLA